MLSGPVLKQFRTYLKSQIGNGWSVEGRQSKRKYLTRVSFRYLSGERSVVLLDIDFDADNQDEIVRTVKRLSELMRERNIDLAKAKELICGGKSRILENENEEIIKVEIKDSDNERYKTVEFTSVETDKKRRKV